MKNKILTSAAFLVVLCLALLPLVTGCQSAEEKVAEKILESAMEAGGNGDVDIDFDADGEEGSVHISSDEGEFNMTIGSDSEWPDDLPSFVPQLDGDIIQVLEAEIDGHKQYTIAYENLGNTDMDSYADKLEGKGWDVQSKMDFNEMWMIQATYGDDEYYLSAAVTDEEDTATLTVGEGE